MGDGMIDGRGGDRMLGQDKTWWDLAEMTRPGYGHQVTRIVFADHADSFTMYRITLKNSANVHVRYSNGDGFTAWGVRIDTPKRQARNTDGIDPQGKNVTITHSYIRDGDDNVAINGGGTGATNMTISHDHFYWGHGMSIGSPTSGGVSKIRVYDVSVDGADNGIRIKSNGSRGGLTHDVRYDNICIRNAPNPVMLDTAYGGGGDLKGPLPPVMRDVTLHNVRISGGGKFMFSGYDQEHRVQVNLDNVLLTDNASYTYAMNHADLHLGPGPVNLKLPAGTDSSVQGTPASSDKAVSCAAMFVPFPVQ
jgi:polygalacturonase